MISGAVAFVLPSAWEGFGIPVVEAMACGTPAIVSNAASLPEVVGEAGLLVDPYSIDQIEQAIRTIYTDKKLRNKLSKLSIAQAKKFSWDKMARAVLKAFQSLSRKPSRRNAQASCRRPRGPCPADWRGLKRSNSSSDIHHVKRGYYYPSGDTSP